MSIFRSQDSMSKCNVDHYSHFYDLHKPAQKKEQATLLRAPSRDVLEISRAKLEQEALNSLRHTSKVTIAQHSFMRVGKYLFLAVALPPIFIIYKIPKWVIVEALPYLLSPVLLMWQKIKEKVVKEGMRQVTLLQKASMVLQRIGSPIFISIKRAAALIQWQWSLFKNSVASAFSPAALVMKKWSLALNFKKPLMRAWFGLLEMGTRSIALLKSSLLRFNERGERFAASFASMWKKDFFKWFSKKQKRPSWDRLTDESRKYAKKGAEFVIQTLKLGVSKFKGDISPFLKLLSFLKRLFSLFFTLIKKPIIVLSKSFVSFARRWYTKITLFLQRSIERLKKRSWESELQDLFERVLQHKWMKKIPEICQKGMRKCLFHPLILKGSATFLQCISLFSRIALKTAMLFLEGSATVIWKLQPFFDRVRKGYLTSLKYLNKGCNAGYESVSFFGYSLLYYFLLLCMISWLVATRKNVGEQTALS